MTLTFCQCGQIKGQCDCRKEYKTTTERGYGYDWQKLSKRVRAEEPLCQDCLKAGRTTPSTQVHHIIPLSEDRSKRMDRDNLVALCEDCHEKRHAASKQQG